MIREGQGDDPIPREPTADPAEDEAIRQFRLGRRRTINHGFISVSPAERIKPARRMKDRAPWVSLHKPRPARIADGVNLINGHLGALLTWPIPASCIPPASGLSGPDEWRRLPSWAAARVSGAFPLQARCTEACRSSPGSHSPRP